MIGRGRGRGHGGAGRGVLAAAALLAVIPACRSGDPSGYRRIETHLGRNATIEANGSERPRDAKGVITVPLRGERQATYIDELRVAEPRKPAIFAEVTVLVEPRGDVEDHAVFSTTANTTIVYTGDRASIAGPTSPVDLLPDPLARLADPEGPYFGPGEGEGLVLVVSRASALAAVDRRPVPLRPTSFVLPCDRVGEFADKTGAPFDPPSYPAAVRLPAGRHALHVEKRGFQTFDGDVEVKAREYRLVFVRLAPEREVGK
jgi:hypothetical protein